MKLADAFDARNEYSGKTSDLTRQLAFAGIAVVWVFSGGGVGDASNVTISDALVWVLVLLVGALVFDYVHYVFLAITWWAFARLKENRLQQSDNEAYREEEFLAPEWIANSAQVAWLAKVVLLLVGYAMLLVELADRVL